MQCYTGEYKGVAHKVCNSKNNLPRKIPSARHNESICYYHFIIKELAEEFEKQFSCLEEKTEKYIAITVPLENEVTRSNRNGEKSQEIYLTYYILLIVQDLWPAHYQILSIIFLKEFIKLNVNMNTTIKNVKLVELYTKYATVFLNVQHLRMI